jgi:hypothetical protein
MGNAISPDAELAVRLAAFVAVFAAMALWEFAAPARVLRLARVARWRANLGLALVNTLLVRVALPTTALVAPSACAATTNAWPRSVYRGYPVGCARPSVAMPWC